MSSCRECCYAAPTGSNLYCSMNECYVGELTCDEFEPIVKPKTNGDRIRSMTDEEMEKHLCCPWKECKNMNLECDKCLLDWLKQEAVE